MRASHLAPNFIFNMKQKEHISTEYLDYIIALGRKEYDLDKFKWRNNEKIRAKHGFSLENFKNIFEGTNLDGRFVYEIAQLSIAFYNGLKISGNGGNEFFLPDHIAVRNYLEKEIDEYLLSGNKKRGEEILLNLSKMYEEWMNGF